MEVDELMKAAAHLAREGGQVIMARRSLARTVDMKGGIDLVTDADRASEEKIVTEISRLFPDHGILAEERGAKAGTSAYRWIIDPLDGTTNYAHGVPHFCVTLAVELAGKGVLAGATYDPIRDEMFLAGKGKGATSNGSPIHVSKTDKLGNALLATGFPYDLWENPKQVLEVFNRIIVKARGMRRLGTAGLDMAYVASGRLDGFFEYRLRAWDVAAGALLIEEAGGVVSHLLGAPLDLFNADVLTANAQVHAQMLEIIRGVMA